MKRRSLPALALGLGVLLGAVAASAQQPPPPPQDRPRVIQLPGGAPHGTPPGVPPGAQKNRPTFPVPGHARPAPAAHAPAHDEHEGGGHGGHFCPGHGPADAPPPPNWWRGLITVNNELSQSTNPLYQLLFRYENHDDPCDAKNQPPPFLAAVLNFGLLAFVLYRFGRQPLAEALVKRKKDILAEIELAQKLKAEAEARLREYRQKFENMADTLDQMRVQYREQAEQEKQHILDEAVERRARMRRDAELRIEQELKAAHGELLQNAVDESIAAAEKLVVKAAGQADMDHLANDYVASLGAALGATRQVAARPNGAPLSAEGAG